MHSSEGNEKGRYWPKIRSGSASIWGYESSGYLEAKKAGRNQAAKSPTYQAKEFGLCSESRREQRRAVQAVFFTDERPVTSVCSGSSHNCTELSLR